METVATKRNTWVACPECGHKVAKVRTCDMEFKCKHCGHEWTENKIEQSGGR